MNQETAGGQQEANKRSTGARVITTFTNDQLLYDPETHHYSTTDGEPLLSGSKYAEEFAKPFDRERLLALTAKKLKTTEEFVGAAWNLRGELARNFGTGLHQAMELWFRYREISYGVPKHPFLKKMVESFPLRDKDVRPELMVSDLARGLVGQIDGLWIPDPAVKEGIILDYKSDAEVGKNLQKHHRQLGFYADILIAAGWSIPRVEVWNFTDAWAKYDSPVLLVDMERAMNCRK